MEVLVLMEEVLGVNLLVDSPDTRHKTDNVMPIFWEEQPFTWLYAKNEIQKTLRIVKGEIDFLDVGTGCGEFAILAAKEFGAKYLDVDKN